MQFSEKQILEALLEMQKEATVLGIENGEVMIGIEIPGKPFAIYSITVGNISREPREGDAGRNYEGTAFAKLAFSRRTHLPSGKYNDVPPKIGETGLKGCVPYPIFGGGWVYFVCAGLHDDNDDVKVAETGYDVLILH